MVLIKTLNNNIMKIFAFLANFVGITVPIDNYENAQIIEKDYWTGVIKIRILKNNNKYKDKYISVDDFDKSRYDVGE